jgi:ABC-type branched-subunit amino acid transport system ATPase component/branched-subunit amino acid ABC-type transport system permease component
VFPFIVIGLTTGAVYALAGTGLVLTYKTSGVFNFAYGGLAAIGAYTFYVLYVLNGWSWPLAAAVAICVVGPVMGLALAILARRLQGASIALGVAATVGLLLVIEAAVQLIYGTQTVRTVPIFLGTAHVRFAGTNIEVSQIVTFCFAIVVTVLLTLILRFARRGVAMRAIVDDSELLGLTGTSPTTVRRTAWVIGVTLASASGVLFAPLLPLDPIQLTLLVASAFGAAAIGAFTSLPLTLAGGLGIGVLASLSTKWFPSGLLSGLSPSFPFVVLFIVVLVFPRRYLVASPLAAPTARAAWRAPARLQLTIGGILLAVLVVAPTFAGVHLTDWTTFVAMSIVFMSLGLLVRASGQVSLSQAAFVAIGATSFSHLTLGAGIPWLAALLLSGLVAVPIGALLAMPAIRLGGLYLALGTFGFGILLQDMFYSQSYMFGGSGLGVDDPRPHLAWLAIGTDRGFYYLTLLIAVLVAGVIVALTRGRLGRLLRGGVDSATALATSGANVTVTRLVAFCISAFLASFGGALAGVGQGTVIADSYQPILSLTWFATIVIVAGGEPWDAVLAAAALFLIPSYISGQQVTTVLQLLFGAGAVGYALLGGSHGPPTSVRRAIDAAFGGWRIRRGRTGRNATSVARPTATPAKLEVDCLTVRFGGILAVDGVSLVATPGLITGLIGPNGAGKSTIVNACSGLVNAAKGRVLLGDHELTNLGPSARAQLGLGRSFQRIELFDSLTVGENVEAGAEASVAGANPLRQVVGRRREHDRIRAAAEDAIALCELTTLRDVAVSSLSTAQRRQVEIARCLAGPYALLMLDEPSSGLDPIETRRLAAILRRVISERGIGVLLVEHDLSLVLDLCGYVYVLDFGELIFEGTPAEVAGAQRVRDAYLGDTFGQDAVLARDELSELS